MTVSNLQVLESVAVKGRLQGLCLELEVTQVFVNAGKRNVEAVYTFPLPHGAVLLDLTVKLGNKQLTGTVMPKQQAEDRYEDAITDGNSAIMLERTDNGICTINVGNLLAGERAELRYRFSQLLNWQQDSLRITLPTTIAPRYGDSAEAGWQPHQITTHSLLADYPFSLALDIEQPLSGALLECPSHAVTIARKGDIARVTLGIKAAWLDRDFILNLALHDGAKDVGQQVPDNDQHVALVSFSPVVPGKEIDSACIKVVVDCSGSMAGDSIAQARTGLLRILDTLRKTDTFNIVRFGSTARAYFPTCVPATGRALRQARQAVEEMQADLGGTEMGNALQLAYKLKDDSDRPASILLITDGEINNHEHIMLEAKASGHRIFSIGVGSAVAEGFVRGIAMSTGGAAELVSPNEGMAAAIFRQFRRMFQPRAVSARIQWPIDPRWQSPESIGAVFSGDTLHVFAGFDQPPAGEACLLLTLDDGSQIQQKVALLTHETKSNELGRIAAAHRIEQMDTDLEDQATALAVDYQLISRYTNYLIIDVRDAEIQPTGLPVIAQVPQTLAAGYAGAGSMRFCDASDDDYDIPLFLRKQADDYDPAATSKQSVIGYIIRSIKDTFTPQTLTPTKAVITVVEAKNWYQAYLKNVRVGLPNELLDVLNALVRNEGWPEETVAAALLLAMLNQLDKAIPRHDKRELVVALKAVNPPQSLIDYFEVGLMLSHEGWDWSSAYELLPMVQ